MNSNPWEKQPGEPTIWYKRFTTYRLMGMQRSLRKVLEGENRQSKNLPGNWLRTAEQWSWRERAEAWDLNELEAQRVEDEEKFRLELKEHRANALAMVRSGLEMSLNAAKLINARLGELAEKAEAGNLEDIEIALIPNLMRAFSAVASASLDCEALVLQVDEILLKLDEPQAPA